MLSKFQAYDIPEAGINAYFDWFGIEVTGGLVPLLSFSLSIGSFYGVTISAVEGFIPVEQCLHIVFTRRNLGQTLNG